MLYITIKLFFYIELEASTSALIIDIINYIQQNYAEETLITLDEIQKHYMSMAILIISEESLSLIVAYVQDSELQVVTIRHLHIGKITIGKFMMT